jgi:hypothetical protein
MKLEDIKQYSGLIEEYRIWLKPFGKERVKKWEDLLKSNFEGAICEAFTQKSLSEYDVNVEPYEDLSKGGPDFICTKGGKTFYVETTCISIEAATKDSGLSPNVPYPSQAQGFSLMTKRIRTEISNKTPQCSNTKAPCIIVIATLHFQAGCLCFGEWAIKDLLTGTPYITRKITVGTGEPIGEVYESTQLEDSAFIRSNKDSPNWIEHARNPVSAILLCGFGSNPPNIIGCLHPSPNYPFDRTLLAQIKFCRLVDGYQSGQLKIEWI